MFLPKTRGANLSWQYLSAVSPMACSSSVNSVLELRGSCQLKTTPAAGTYVLRGATAERRAAVLALAAFDLKMGRNMVVNWHHGVIGMKNQQLDCMEQLYM